MIPNGQSEAVDQRGTNITMAKTDKKTNNV